VAVPSWFVRLARPPWAAAPGAPAAPRATGTWYEDWYLVDGWAALGELNAAAVSGPRRAPHAAAATLAADGTAGIYGLLAGDPARPAWAAWLAKPQGAAYEAFEPELRAAAGPEASVWRRQMVLGPTPEFAVLGDGAQALPWPAVETGPT
jgi:hypothetical protein